MEKKGISFQGFVPLRLEPGHSSEMTSQVLFGEGFTIKGEKHGWLLIALDFDGSEGWVCKESVRPLESADSLKQNESGYGLVIYPSISALDLNSGHPLILPAGSRWPSFSDRKVMLGGRYLELLSMEGLQQPDAFLDLEEAGSRLLSLPYILGGRCGFGFDGPGLIQMLLSLREIKLPRTCASQAELGQTVNFLHEAKAGDLAFFDNEEGEITHVGMLLHGGRILHAHHQVRMDRFDQQGIYCSERDRYTHKLRIIKRIE